MKKVSSDQNHGLVTGKRVTCTSGYPISSSSVLSGPDDSGRVAGYSSRNRCFSTRARTVVLPTRKIVFRDPKKHLIGHKNNKS